MLITVLEFSRQPLRFSDSLTGPKELRKAVLLSVIVYYSEQMNIKISKKNMRHILGIPGTNFQLSSWQTLLKVLMLSAMVRDNTYRGLLSFPAFP